MSVCVEVLMTRQAALGLLLPGAISGVASISPRVVRQTDHEASPPLAENKSSSQRNRPFRRGIFRGRDMAQHTLHARIGLQLEHARARSRSRRPGRAAGIGKMKAAGRNRNEARCLTIRVGLRTVGGLGVNAGGGGGSRLVGISLRPRILSLVWPACYHDLVCRYDVEPQSDVCG